jgi:hypothetical protein
VEIEMSAFNLSLVVLTASFLLGACSSEAVEEDAGDDNGALSNDTGSARGASKLIAPGKYVKDAPNGGASETNALILYGRCSPDNSFGAAGGALGSDGKTISLPEGDLCGAYALSNVDDGVVKVTWKPNPSANLDRSTVAACRAHEGQYSMTVPGFDVEIAPGNYTRTVGTSKKTLTVEEGCETPSSLGGIRGIIAPTLIGESKKAFLAPEEGEVCGGFVLAQVSPRTVRVTWQDADTTNLSSENARRCRALEGDYATE